ncbi:MAG: class I tRNA ligase family protein, partial [Patescibacteria group bacterium]
AKRETDTMPNWAGSSWYFLRYCDNNNKKELADKKKLDYYMPVDWYNGGMEHTTLHLLYSRFWNIFLYDIGVVPASEPYIKRRSHGFVLGSDGRKMSKSFNNVINPDEIVKKYGADSLRLYEMFMGPFEETINWNTQGLEGCSRFLKKVWFSLDNIGESNKEMTQKLHYLIKKVENDIENNKFNTAVAAMMEFVNSWQENSLEKKHDEMFLKVLCVFCPHICEELWERLGNKESIFLESWPEYDEKLIKKDKFELVIQINGKVRDKIEVDSEISQEQAEKLVLSSDKIKSWLIGKKPKKIIFIKEKLINIVL